MEIVSVGWSTELALLQARSSVVEHHRTHAVVRTPDRPEDRTGNFVLLRRAPRGNDVTIALQRFAAAFGPAAPVSFGVDDPDGTRSDLAPLAAQGLTTEAPLVLVATEVVRPAVGDVEVRTVEEGGAGTEVRFEATVGGRPAGTSGVSAAGPGWARLLAPWTSGADRVAGITQLLVFTAYDHAVRRGAAQGLVVVADEGHDAIPLYLSMGFRVAERQLRAFAPGVAGTGAT